MVPNREVNFTKMTPLTSFELKVLAFIEYYFNLHKVVPTDEHLDEKFNLTFSTVVSKPAFSKALLNRGIPLIQQDERTGLGVEQINTIHAVVDFTDKRSFSAKLRNCGVSKTQWNGWMKDQVFKNYYHSLANDLFVDSLPRVQEAIIKSAEAGNPAAAKFYYEVTGRTRNENNQNIQILLTRLVEAIQTHVDADTMRLIENDFKQIMQGNPIERKAIDV